MTGQQAAGHGVHGAGAEGHVVDLPETGQGAGVVEPDAYGLLARVLRERHLLVGGAVHDVRVVPDVLPGGPGVGAHVDVGGRVVEAVAAGQCRVELQGRVGEGREVVGGTDEFGVDGGPAEGVVVGLREAALAAGLVAAGERVAEVPAAGAGVVDHAPAVGGGGLVEGLEATAVVGDRVTGREDAGAGERQFQVRGPPGRPEVGLDGGGPVPGVQAGGPHGVLRPAGQPDRVVAGRRVGERGSGHSVDGQPGVHAPAVSAAVADAAGEGHGGYGVQHRVAAHLGAVGDLDLPEVLLGVAEGAHGQPVPAGRDDK